MDATSEIVRDSLYALELLVWLGAAVLAIRMVRRCNARGDRMFLIGVALVLFDLLVLVLSWIAVNQKVTDWLVAARIFANATQLMITLLVLNVVRTCAYVTGIALIVIAYYHKCQPQLK